MNAIALLLALWHPIGPDGGTFYKVVVDGQYMFASAGARSWMSDDGGGTWRHLPLGWLRDAASDPSDRNVLWVATLDGLIRSRDGGANFTRIVNDSFESVVFDGSTMLAGGDGTVYVTTDGGASFASSRIDNGGLRLCAGGGIVYAAGSKLSRSTDGGSTWTTVHDGYGYVACDGDRIWKSNGGVLERSDDRGDHWATIAKSIGGGALVADPATHRLYTVAFDALRVSDDGGATWRDVAGIPGWSVSAFAAAGSRLLLSAGGHLMTSDDGGGAWRFTEAGLAAGSVGSLAVDPIVPGLLLAGIDGDVVRRENGAWTTSFHDPSLPATGVAFDPAIPARAVALAFEPASGGEILFHTRNSAATWSKSANVTGTRAGSTPWQSRVIFDPRNPAAVYVVDRSWYRDTLHASSDFGATWRDVGPGGMIHAFALVPGAMLAGTDYGLYRSADNGATWTAAAPRSIEDGCSSTADFHERVLAIAVDGPTIVMARWNCFGARIYKSSDGGRSWRSPGRLLQSTFFGPGWPVGDVEAIIVDPKHSQRFFAATNLGVFESDDSGESWHTINDGFDADVGPISAIAIDPETDRLYAGTQYGGVWVLDLSDAPPRRRAAR